MSAHRTTRRAMLAGAATLSATTAIATGAAIATDDPIFAAIEKLRRTEAEFHDVCEQLDEAEFATGEKWPCPLVAWRTYSMIGCTEIERARDEFLALGLDPRKIEKEYREKKEEEVALLRAEDAYYERNGLAPLRAKKYELLRATKAAEWRLARTKPASALGAATLLAFVRDYNEDSEPGDWTEVALKNVEKALRHRDVRLDA
jgi:hypothetical protein